MVHAVFTVARTSIHTKYVNYLSRAHMRTYQRPRPPSLWVPGMTVIPSVAGEHGPGGLSPTEAVTGLHRAPRAVGCLRPRGGPTSGASVIVSSAGDAPTSCTPSLLALVLARGKPNQQ